MFTPEGQAALHSSHGELCLVPKTLQALAGRQNDYSNAPDMAAAGGMAKGAAAPTLRCMAAQSPLKALSEPVALPR